MSDETFCSDKWNSVRFIGSRLQKTPVERNVEGLDADLPETRSKAVFFEAFSKPSPPKSDDVRIALSFTEVTESCF